MRVIIYSVGPSHQLYFNLTDEEAERRWQEQRDNRALLEAIYEDKMGWTVQRTVHENITDEFFIWGDAGKELADITQDLFLAIASNTGEGK